MAANGTVNIQQAESVVNRWLVDYYMFLAIDLLEKEQYNDFFAIQNVLFCILSRPLESTENTPKKIKLLDFLVLINKGELEVTPDADSTLSPLESAFEVLQSLKEDCHQLEYDTACSSLIEMIVKIFIMNGQKGKAKEALKHFPKSMNGKKATLMSLIAQKSGGSNIVDQVRLDQFKQEMLAFCQKLCQFRTPFLFKAAVQLIHSRHPEPDRVEASEQQREPEKNISKQAHLQQCSRPFMEKSRLVAGFQALAHELSFSDVEDEAQGEDISLHLPSSSEDADEEVRDQLYHRTTDSPMEASPADEPAQICDAPPPQTCPPSEMGTISTKRPQYSIGQLVVEPDSPVLSQEVHNELTTNEILEKSTRTPETLDNTPSPIMECEVCKPVRKHCFKSGGRTAKTRSEDKTPTRHEDGSCSDEIVRSVFNNGRDTQDEIADGLDNSPGPSAVNAVPQKSSTPNKDSSTILAKWKQAFSNARESKEGWSDEEELFDDKLSDESLSSPAHRKRRWTDSETERLKDGVKRFGEGKWHQIKAYYKFTDRTNVNLKDRWRTMKNMKLV